MLRIDGSMGEGGGSVLRLSLAFSAVVGEPIEVTNIRKKRSRPGLANQHLHAVEALRKLTNGETEGETLGSKRVVLRPGKIKEGKIQVDIGTAGSTTLTLQAVMLPAAFGEEPIEIEITGGTDNPFAPPIDYLLNVTLPVLKTLGYRGEVRCIKRGHYPQGGGKITAKIKPLEKLRPLKLTDRGEVHMIHGRSHCVRLPSHIAERQADAAKKELNKAGYDTEIEREFYKKEEDPHLGPGTGIVLWSETETGAILGSSALGKKGKPAEDVGKEAAKKLIEQMDTGMAFDKYLTDQLIPYLGLAHGESDITSAEITSHTLTNIKLVKKIFNKQIKVDGNMGQPGKITVKND